MYCLLSSVCTGTPPSYFPLVSRSILPVVHEPLVLGIKAGAYLELYRIPLVTKSPKG